MEKSILTLPQQTALDDYIQTLKLKSYSANTIRTYSAEFVNFLIVFKNYNPHDISTDLIRRYLVYCAEDLKLTEHFINSKMNAIKFYYEKVLFQPKVVYNIPRPKKPYLLPKVLSVKDIKNLFKVVENKKHLLILKCIYGMGLRVSEIVSLKISDIDSDTMLVHLKNAKGKKDRVVVLPDSILDQLRIYYKENLPQIYLFENRFHQQYNVRTIQTIFKNALRKTSCHKNVGIHSLRHSYATHLLEAGTDISLIQQLLGHNNIKTTLTYTHVSRKTIQNVRSPLDNL